MLDLLVRHQPTDHRDRRVRGLAGIDVHHRVGAVVHDRDPRPADAEPAELGAGGARDRDVLRVPVEPRREAALDPPAHLGHRPAVDDGPLLAVHVVHQHDHRRPGHEAREEGEPVLHVDDQVDGAEPATRQPQHPSPVDGELGPPAHEPDPVDDLVGGCGRVRGAEDRHPAAARDQTGRHLLEVPLRAAALGVVGVAPAEEDDVAAAQVVEVMHPAHASGTGRAGGTRLLR